MVVPNEEVPPTGFILSDAWYARAKWFVTIVLPAFGTLYFTLGSLFDLPAVTQVIGACAALAIFLGVILGISSNTYNHSDARFDGVMNVTTNDEGIKTASMELNRDPQEIIDMSEVRFKVVPESEA